MIAFQCRLDDALPILTSTLKSIICRSFASILYQPPVELKHMLTRRAPSLGSRFIAGQASSARQASTTSVPTRSRSAKWFRRSGIVVGLGAAVYVVDKQYNASAVTRSLRTAYIGWVIFIFYPGIQACELTSSILCTLDCKHI
jgi:hypothetical protein